MFMKLTVWHIDDTQEPIWFNMHEVIYMKESEKPHCRTMLFIRGGGMFDVEEECADIAKAWK